MAKNPSSNLPSPNEVARQVVESAQTPPQQAERFNPRWDMPTISTGSLLLDLAISGLKTRYGGMPWGGGRIEIYGDSGLGKTTIAGELAGAAQRLGGEVFFDDPEYRLEPDYCKKMGVEYTPEKFLYPDTFTQLEESIIGPLKAGAGGKVKRDMDKAWVPDPDKPNCRCIDSITAVCSKMELEQGDKMGGRRAIDLSTMLRRITRHIRRHNILLVFTNQIRDNMDAGMFGPKTKSTGGHAPKFYTDIRVELRFRGLIKAGDAILGKYVEAKVVKSSLDVEYRTATLRMVFNYGLDDLGANVEWLHQQGGLSTLPDGTKARAGSYIIGDYCIPPNVPGGAFRIAIDHIEKNNLEAVIREQVVDTWRKLEAEARPARKDKVRW